MNFQEIDAIIEESKLDPVSDALAARSIASNSRVDPYYSFLRRLVIDTKPKGVFLEIGCYQGVVAAYIADARGWHDHQYIGIDINPVPFSDQNCVFIQENASRWDVACKVSEMANMCGEVFAIFQDSSHHYADSVREWELYSPMIRKGGLWICDDITPAFRTPEEPKGMVEYFDELPGEKRLYDDLHIGSRIGIVLL